jgi:hypothetical protein
MDQYSMPDSPEPPMTAEPMTMSHEWEATCRSMVVNQQYDIMPSVRSALRCAFIEIDALRDTVRGHREAFATLANDQAETCVERNCGWYLQTVQLRKDLSALRSRLSAVDEQVAALQRENAELREDRDRLASRGIDEIEDEILDALSAAKLSVRAAKAEE